MLTGQLDKYARLMRRLASPADGEPLLTGWDVRREVRRLRRSSRLADPHFAGDISLLRGSWTQMMSTELNSLAAATGAIQSTGTNPAFDNTLAAGTGLFFWGDFEANLTYGTAPTAGKTVDLYVIPLGSAGGTTFWDGSATIQQATLYAGSWILRNITTAHILGIRGVPLPPQKFIISIVNNGDQALAASGNTVKFFAYGEAYT